MITSRAGIQSFVCGDCGLEWDELSRDAASPSGEPCPVCQNFCHPDDYQILGWPLEMVDKILLSRQWINITKMGYRQ